MTDPTTIRDLETEAHRALDALDAARLQEARENRLSAEAELALRERREQRAREQREEERAAAREEAERLGGGRAGLEAKAEEQLAAFLRTYAELENLDGAQRQKLREGSVRLPDQPFTWLFDQWLGGRLHECGLGRRVDPWSAVGSPGLRERDPLTPEG